MYGIAVLLVISLVSGQQLQRYLELEDILSKNQKPQTEKPHWVWRSNAINLKTLRIVDQGQQYSINISLCISPNPPSRRVAVQVETIRYSNDGPSDTVTVRIGDNFSGTFRTIERSDGGHGWNVFHDSRPIGKAISLPEGQYTLSLQAKTDRWGVELDRIVINAENQNEHVDLICNSELTESAPRNSDNLLKSFV